MKFLTSVDLYLRPLHENDVNGPYPSWLNDPEVCQGTSHHIYPYSIRQANEYIQQANASDKALILAIVLNEDHTHIGNVALQRINYIYRTAEFAIMIGDKRYWGKGYGLQAAKLLLKHGFTVLNLNRIECGTLQNNIGMQKLALALGMQQEGVRRKAAYKNESYVDIVEYGLLKEEFNLST